MSFTDELRNVLVRDPAARNAVEVLLCYPGFHALQFYRVSNWLWKKRCKLPARWLSQVASMVTGIEIHPGATIGERFFIDHGQGVVIGETTEIGNDVTIYQGVTLGGLSLEKVKRHPTIQDGVMIGAGAILLGPITVGARSKIGAGVVLTASVEPDTTIGLIPRLFTRRHDS